MARNCRQAGDAQVREYFIRDTAYGGQVAQCTREGAALTTRLVNLCIVRPGPVYPPQ